MSNYSLQLYNMFISSIFQANSLPISSRPPCCHSTAFMALIWDTSSLKTKQTSSVCINTDLSLIACKQSGNHCNIFQYLRFFFQPGNHQDRPQRPFSVSQVCLVLGLPLVLMYKVIFQIKSNFVLLMDYVIISCSLKKMCSRRGFFFLFTK